MNINVDLIYPIGSLYLTTSTVSPSVLFGGTWERIKNDAYLKIATGNSAGTLGGTSSNHKIPLSSMPSHTHSVKFDQSSNGGTTWLKTGGNSGGPYYSTEYVQSAGGGQAYYPYYYQVFVWKRTA